MIVSVMIRSVPKSEVICWKTTRLHVLSGRKPCHVRFGAHELRIARRTNCSSCICNDQDTFKGLFLPQLRAENIIPKQPPPPNPIICHLFSSPIESSSETLLSTPGLMPAATNSQMAFNAPLTGGCAGERASPGSGATRQP